MVFFVTIQDSVDELRIHFLMTIVPRNSASFLSSLPVSLDCHFLIAPSVFSIVYLEKMTVSVLVSDYTCTILVWLMQNLINQVIKLCFIAKSV
jgi:hypothetical protein